MFERNDCLLLDIGNTRVHWRQGSARGDAEHATLLAMPPEDWPWHGSVLQQVLCVSVGSAAIKTRLQNALLHDDTGWHQFAGPVPALLSSNYDPSQLGHDRWLAALGARTVYPALTDKPLIVINAGTAVTVDILDVYGHKGGWIMPGYRLWHTALTQGTQIRRPPAPHATLEPGRDTSAAMVNAWLVAVNGLLQQARQQLSAGGVAEIVVTGGDTERLLAQWPDARVCQDLVLAGLEAWGQWYQAQHSLFDRPAGE